MPEVFSQVRESYAAGICEQHQDEGDLGNDLRRMGSGARSTNLRPSTSRRPTAAKKIGVEMSAARAETIPQANIAARMSESAAMSMNSFHTVSPGRRPLRLRVQVVRLGVVPRATSSNDVGSGTRRCRPG
jgi:hypothetical protein